MNKKTIIIGIIIMGLILITGCAANGLRVYKEHHLQTQLKYLECIGIAEGGPIPYGENYLGITETTTKEEIQQKCDKVTEEYKTSIDQRIKGVKI